MNRLPFFLLTVILSLFFYNNLKANAQEGYIPKRGSVLKKGDTIGIVALSSIAVDENDTKKGIEYLKSLGFQVKLASNVEENYFHFAGSPQCRAKELEKFFQDPEVDAIMAVRGGYGAIEILDLLDYKIIKKHPKIFIGFSDLTVIQMALYKHVNLITFHGPMVRNFSNPQHSSISDKSLFDLLFGNTNLVIDGFNILSQTSADSVEGVLLGGNLSTFISLMGTPYEIDFTDKILFFEDTDEYLYRIDRYFTQLILSRKLSSVKAIIFGDFNNCNKRGTHEKDLELLIRDKFEHLGIPIITNVASGHCFPMFTLPIGAKVKLDMKNKKIFLLEDVIKKSL